MGISMAQPMFAFFFFLPDFLLWHYDLDLVLLLVAQNNVVSVARSPVRFVYFYKPAFFRCDDVFPLVRLSPFRQEAGIENPQHLLDGRASDGMGGAVRCPSQVSWGNHLRPAHQESTGLLAEE